MFLANQALLEKISSAFSANTFPQTCLITGIVGSGKTLLAKYLSMYTLQMYTLQKKDKNNFLSFIKKPITENYHHPDLLYIQPEKQRITIETVREINQYFYFTSENKNRILLMDNIECMTNQSAHAFLKILESSSNHKICFLTSSFPNNLSRHLISRCLLIRLQALSNQEIINYLQTNNLLNDLSHQSIEMILMLSQGSLGIAIELANNTEIFLKQLLENFISLYNHNQSNKKTVSNFLLTLLEEKPVFFRIIMQSFFSLPFRNLQYIEKLSINMNKTRFFFLYENIKNIFHAMDPPVVMSARDIIYQLMEL